MALMSCDTRTSQSNELSSKIYYDEDSCLGGDYEFRKDIDTTLLDENARQEYRETLYYESLPDTIVVVIPESGLEVHAYKCWDKYCVTDAYYENRWWFTADGKFIKKETI